MPDFKLNWNSYNVWLIQIILTVSFYIYDIPMDHLQWDIDSVTFQ